MVAIGRKIRTRFKLGPCTLNDSKQYFILYFLLHSYSNYSDNGSNYLN